MFIAELEEEKRCLQRQLQEWQSWWSRWEWNGCPHEQQVLQHFSEDAIWRGKELKKDSQAPAEQVDGEGDETAPNPRPDCIIWDKPIDYTRWDRLCSTLSLDSEAEVFDGEEEEGETN